MDLHDKIRSYYFTHLEQLPLDKQFHFATRLSAWESDDQANAILSKVKADLVPTPQTNDSLASTLGQILDKPPKAKVNALDARQPYFDMFPKLRAIDFVLFRVRHWRSIYNIDGREALQQLLPLNELLELKSKLLNNPDALRVLSTYAVNFVYLLERNVLEHDNPEAINLDYIYDLADGYGFSNPEHLQLCIYLYTHCIIGDSNFYLRRPPQFAASAYRRMLGRLDKLISDNFDNINLDNKLEFLVCCRICNYQTPLFDRVESECQESISPNGTFLIDSRNSHSQSSKTSLADSEHRNVLYIMSRSAFDKP